MAELNYPAAPIAINDTLIGTPDGATRIAKDNPDFPGELFWDFAAANDASPTLHTLTPAQVAPAFAETPSEAEILVAYNALAATKGAGDNIRYTTPGGWQFVWEIYDADGGTPQLLVQTPDIQRYTAIQTATDFAPALRSIIRVTVNGTTTQYQNNVAGTAFVEGDFGGSPSPVPTTKYHFGSLAGMYASGVEDSCTIMYRANSGDGGGGVFSWIPTYDRTTADGVIAVDPSVGLNVQGTGAGTGCYVRESKQIHVEWWGDDSAALVAALAKGLELQKNIHHDGLLTIDTKIDLGADGNAYWRGTEVVRPIEINLNHVLVTTTDTGFYCNGQFMPTRLYINHARGPGKTYPAADPTPRGGAERILVEIYRGGHDIRIGSMTNFNIGILAESAWTGRIELGPAFDVSQPLYVRRGVNGESCQALDIHMMSSGGIYNNGVLADSADRSQWSSHYGMNLEALKYSRIWAGACQYAVERPDSIAIKVDEYSYGLEIDGYIEGTIADSNQYLLYCRGHNCEFNLGPAGAPSGATTAGGVDLGGTGNVLSGIYETQIDAASTAESTTTGSPIIIIRPGNIMKGGHYRYSVNPNDFSNSIKEELADIVHTENVNANATHSLDPNVPAGWHYNNSNRIVITDNSVGKHEYAGIALREGLMDLHIVARNNSITTGAQLAWILKDQTNNVVGADTLSLPKTGEWVGTIPAISVGGSSNVGRLVIAVRSGQGPSGTVFGCDVSFTRPTLTPRNQLHREIDNAARFQLSDQWRTKDDPKVYLRRAGTLHLSRTAGTYFTFRNSQPIVVSQVAADAIILQNIQMDGTEGTASVNFIVDTYENAGVLTPTVAGEAYASRIYYDPLEHKYYCLYAQVQYLDMDRSMYYAGAEEFILPDKLKSMIYMGRVHYIGQALNFSGAANGRFVGAGI